LFLRPAFGFDPRDVVGRQVFYTAFDGTRIPMFIAHRRDFPPGAPRPLYMYGYGAFGWSAFPWFQPQVLAWIEAGGVYAIPCIRGGGEYGDVWHEAATREKKQTSVDDYLAAGEGSSPMATRRRASSWRTGGAQAVSSPRPPSFGVRRCSARR
jgi:prolyl oligopeptidase